MINSFILNPEDVTCSYDKCTNKKLHRFRDLCETVQTAIRRAMTEAHLSIYD